MISNEFVEVAVGTAKSVDAGSIRANLLDIARKCGHWQHLNSGTRSNLKTTMHGFLFGTIGRVRYAVAATL